MCKEIEDYAEKRVKEVAAQKDTEIKQKDAEIKAITEAKDAEIEQLKKQLEQARASKG